MKVELRDIIHLYTDTELFQAHVFHFDTELARTLRVYKCVFSIPLRGSVSDTIRKLDKI